jgi:hypothetical protein
MCGPIGRREIFLTSSLLVEIEGHFSLEFVNYVCETEDWSLPCSGSSDDCFEKDGTFYITKDAT